MFLNVCSCKFGITLMFLSNAVFGENSDISSKKAGYTPLCSYVCGSIYPYVLKVPCSYKKIVCMFTYVRGVCGGAVVGGTVVAT